MWWVIFGYNVGLLKNCELIPSIVFLHCNIAISEYRGIVLAKQYRVHCSTLQRNAVSRLRNGTICQNGWTYLFSSRKIFSFLGQIYFMHTNSPACMYNLTNKRLWNSDFKSFYSAACHKSKHLKGRSGVRALLDRFLNQANLSEFPSILILATRLVRRETNNRCSQIAAQFERCQQHM